MYRCMERGGSVPAKGTCILEVHGEGRVSQGDISYAMFPQIAENLVVSVD